jgi:putative phage-type endonuclease
MSNLLLNEMQQGSLEWHEHRAKYDNASEAAIIMDCAPKYWGTSKRILWEQKQGLRGSNVDSDNPAIQHGNNMESAARDCFNKNFGANTRPVVGVKGTYSASLDGHGTDAEGQSIKVEIKCPWKGVDSEVWKLAASGEIAEYYHWQMVHQSHCVDTEQTFFFVYISDDQFLTIPHISSDEDTAALLSAWEEFNASEPEPDFVLMEDAHMQVLVEEHQLLIDRQKHLKTQLEQVENTMKSKAGDKNVIAFGCKIQTINRKGSVDYKKIENLKDVDLEQYRKPASTYQKISYSKQEA